MATKHCSCAVAVAHPDDETLWAGGLIMLNPECSWTIVSLCRKNDSDRAPKFFKALSRLNAGGAIGDLDDGPDQKPLDPQTVERMILDLLPKKKFDLILTHSTKGEYTRHRRHEETGKAVLSLWEKGKIICEELWMFAYEDEGGRKLPRAMPSAEETVVLTDEIIDKKKSLLIETYGFAEDSWEARAAPRTEAFNHVSKMALI